MKKIITFVIVCLLHFPVYASNCFSGVCSPVITKQVVTKNVQDIVIEQRVVNFDADYFLGLNGYYQGYQKLSQSDDRVDRLISILEKMVNNGQLKPQEESNKQQPLEKPNLSLDAEVYGIFKKSCVQCHQEGGRGKLSLIKTEGGKDFLFNLDCKDRIKVFDSVHSGRMPLDGTPLSDKEVDVIKRWMIQKSKE